MMKKFIKTIIPAPVLNFALRKKRQIIVFTEKIGKIFPISVPSGARISSSSKVDFFFGYYDVTPFSLDSNLLLSMRCNEDYSSPHESGHSVDVGFFDLTKPTPEFQKIGESESWNWQQGCRLQWYPGHGRRVFYNTVMNGEVSGVVQDIDTKEIVQTFSCPLYALDPQGRYGATLNFSRLHHYRRGYGYHNVEDLTLSQAIPDQDGVFIVDMASGKKTLILSLAEIAAFQNKQRQDGDIHYVNHLCFNPSGTRIMFFHLWLDQEKKRNIRLMTVAPDGSDLYVLDYDVTPSHYSWIDDETLLITGENSKGDVRYLRFKDGGQDVEVVSKTLCRDGHPSVLMNGNILSDTYPDILGRQHLFLYDAERDCKRNIASFHHPSMFRGEMRCDFHPRLSPHQDKICIDVVYRGRRALCVIPNK